MADLTAGQIPIVANVPNGGVALIAASANTVTIGSNTNGLAVYTAGTKGACDVANCCYRRYCYSKRFLSTYTGVQL